ncbi:XRE family transcriptional regulator [Streptomyces klenkii]|uniref:XRE family transcriptional regulator n=1 Tax=Streptomyces klenkii TaxID=1420899 RepID=A0A3B0AL78_9ACTN|nr:tetratricopeptide repeat protein [Streptomyces klenkii]RKN61370.1 XRE family transcriptional regulator [Streptomyces klenkii]
MDTGQDDPAKGNKRPRQRRTPLPELAELTANLNRAFRDSQYETRTQLVNRTDLSPSEVSEMLSGTARRGPDAYRRLAEALGVAPKDINSWLAKVDERRERTAGLTSPVSLEAPVALLPPSVRGRTTLWAELRRRLTSPARRLLVLHGMGGSGKSTLALRLVSFAQDRGIPAWWVPALDEETVAAHLYELAAALGATTRELAAARATGNGPRLLWGLLDKLEGPWLLVLDGADRLPAKASGSVADGTGWIRPSARGLVVITSRDSNPHRWGTRANRRPVKPLGRDDAGQVLLDYAPEAGRAQEAQDLGERVGGVPLALHLIGSYLRTSFGAATTFTQYQAELERRTAAFLDQGGPTVPPAARTHAHLRQMITYTWELSLDALDERGMSDARTLLRLLSGFAPTPLPVDTLDPELLAGRIGGEPTTVSAKEVFTPGTPPSEDERDRLLAALADMGLIDVDRTSEGTRWLQMHSLVAEVSNLHLHKDSERAQSTALLVCRLLCDFDDHHQPSAPENWPLWAMLVPHVRHVLDNAPDSPEGKFIRIGLVWACEQAANYLNRSGDTAAARRLLEQASHLTDRPDAARTFRPLLNRRRAEYAADPQERVRLAGRAMREGLVTSEFPPEEWLRAAQMRAAGLLEVGSVARAAEEIDAYVKLAEQVLGARHRVTVDIRLTRANVWTTQDKHQAAVDELTALLHIVRQDPEAGEEDGIRINLAAALTSLGDFEVAEEHARAVIRARARRLGPDHPDTLRNRILLAGILRGQQRMDEALRESADALALARRRLPPGHETILSLHLSAAEALAWSGNLERAEEELAALEPAMNRLTVPAQLWMNYLKQVHLVRRWRREGMPSRDDLVAMGLGKQDPELQRALLAAVREHNATIVELNNRAGLKTPPIQTLDDH